jgi:hypothetical protein
MNYGGSRALPAHRLRISPYAVVLRDGACEVVLAMALPWKGVMEGGGLFKAKSDDE